MIFHHRINSILKDKDYYDVMGLEMDFRSHNNQLVIQHDPIDNVKELSTFNMYLSRMNLKMDPDVKIIANVKESGIEEPIINTFSFYNKDYYFLDSQIPDIVRISKKFPEMKHRFILRVSNFETLNLSLLNFLQSKYVWVDWHNFDDFDESKYLNYINNIIKDLNSINVEPILVSPELYNLDYHKYLLDIKHKIEGEYSVCTKFPSEWENYAKPD